MLLREGGDGGEALRDPGAGVEEVGGVAEGRVVDLDRRAAERAQADDAGGGELGGGVVAEKLELRGAGNAKAEGDVNINADTRAASGLGGGARVGVGGVVDGNDLGDGGGAGEGKDAHAIERAAGGHEAGGADEALGGFPADEVVERGGHAAGAGGVGAEGERNEAGGGGHGAARAGAAGDVAGIKYTAGRAVGRAHADQAGGELVEVGLADDEGSGGAGPAHALGVGGGRVGEGRAGGGGGEDLGLGAQRDPHVIVAARGDAGIDLADELHGRGPGGVGDGKGGET